MKENEMNKAANLFSTPIRAKITVDKNVASCLVCKFQIDEVYANARFLLGCRVDIKTETDDTYQGIFQAFSHSIIFSKYNGQILERELEPWDEKAGENDMFRTNEHYGLSTYDNTLSGYTTPLERKNTTNTTKIALEIGSSPNYLARTAVENGDEEEKFSAVAYIISFTILLPPPIPFFPSIISFFIFPFHHLHLHSFPLLSAPPTPFFPSIISTILLPPPPLSFFPSKKCYEKKN
uniref:LsmAD domain-containing protein n=1 Tax=Strigamia maritima TaxID=126957 RepID=T1J6M5_STRMM